MVPAEKKKEEAPDTGNTTGRPLAAAVR
jgi:hypothetical protein